MDILLPRSDFVFKLIFGDSRNTDILASFLQAVIDLPAREYEEITVIDPHLKREYGDDKLGILDVRIMTKSGNEINVEIQVEPLPYLKERIVFYSSKMITQQINKSQAYNTIKRVICIVITGYTLLHENEKYHNKFQLYDKNTDTRFSDLLEINTLELSKIPKTEDNSELYNWIRFLKAKKKEELDMVADTNPNIQKAVGIVLELSADEAQRLIYEEHEKVRMDNLVRYYGGFEDGEAEGEAKAKANTARITKLFLKQYTPERISKELNLPMEYVTGFLNMVQD
ncbi:hypothetical protein AGMMS49975_28540 [Clostridia bacterium]|nr:hypothetical protein AGMMS49975_28540 [Clostridia bacterium]